ncbi:MAG: histidinol-phosphatase [Chloroflexi bacterium]|nr:histidinol-phosphatase [Chloroflexota bacterium]
MIPPLIVQTALEQEINLIAITDHNASDNVGAVIEAAQGSDLIVFPGIELQTQEDVHVLCLFDTLEQLSDFQSLVDKNLPSLQNNIEYFGEQFIVDATGDFLDRKQQLLITGTYLSFNKAFQAVTDLGGLFIPAHVNRKMFGLYYHLGFVPPDLPIEALELSRHITVEQAWKEYPQTRNYPLIQSGDVHYLADFLGVNQFLLDAPTIAELKLAFKGEKGRRFEISSSLDNPLQKI